MTYKNLPKKNAFAGKIIRDYILDKEVGRGHIGVVYKSHHKDIEDLVAACKIIPNGNLKSNWETELIKASKLTSITQIVQYRHHGPETLDGSLYICIFWEYVPGLNLRDYAKAHPKLITLPFIVGFVKEMLTAFTAMKATGITHDDLHEGNILVNDSDTRLVIEEPRFKISDFGIGSSRNKLKPKDDYIQLAKICQELLAKYVDPSELDGESRYLFDGITQEFLTKRILEKNTTAGKYVTNPRELLKELEIVQTRPNKSSTLNSTIKLKPFDYLSCETIGNDFVLLHRLYSENFPGYDELLLRNNTVLTGPRGCGKTTIFRNMGLKTQLLSQGSQFKNEIDFIGIYYYCGDLFFAFPYQKDEVSTELRRAIVHYFNIAILTEVIDTIEVANNNNAFTLTNNEIYELQQYFKLCLPDYNLPPKGTNALSHMHAFAVAEKQRFKFRLSKSRNIDLKMQLLPLDFVPNLSKMLREKISWFKNKPIYFLIDDYSLPKISRSIQTSLNDFIFGRYQECIFKISTESVTTFHPYDSSNKLLEETREYDVIDLGDYFLHASQATKQGFLREVINNRLKYSEIIHSDYHDIAKIMGTSHYKSKNAMALEIRQAVAGSHTYYYGWDIITGLCSGDIAHMLRLIRDIFSGSGGYKQFSSPGTSIPLDKVIQDHAIRELGNEFLTLVEALPETGKDLRQIAEAFGKLANWYLRNRNSKNQKNNPPWQAFKIEVRQTPYFEDEMLKRKYNDLLRCAVFLRDVSGKSQRGAVVPRLYLRRLLLPTFLLTPSSRDNIGLEVEEFFLLLSNPAEFFEKMKRKRQKSNIQGSLL